MRMASDDIEEVILELKRHLEEYVDRRFEELLEHLSGRGEAEKIKKELLSILVREVEKLRNELINEAKPKDLGTIIEKLDELSREVEAIKQLINRLSTASGVRQETALTEAKLRQLVTEEVRKLEQEKRRRRARRAALLLIGAVAGAAAVIAIAYELTPWLLPLIVIAAIAWLRR